jgi:hypothetical protein
VVVFVAVAVGRGSREINQGKGSSIQRLTRRKTPIEELKDAAIKALVNALDDDKRAAKSGMQGVRTLATGAVIYTAGRAAFKGQRFVREQLSSDTEDDQAEDLEDEEEMRAYEEPEGAESDVDEEEDEPEAVEDDEAYADDDEPEASEEDEDEPEAVEEDDEPEAYEEDEDEPDEDEDAGDDEPDEGDRGPSGDEQEEPQGDEDSEGPKARREPDDESSSKTPPPLPERTPVRRAARKKGAQPSLTLPKQRRARTWVSND